MTVATIPAVTATGAQLRRAVTWVNPGTHPGRPVLGAIRVTVAAGRLILSSFDCETTRMADFTLGPDTGTASVLVDGAALRELALAGPDGRKPVEVAVTSGQVDLTGQGERLSLAGIDPAGYPQVPGVPGLAGIIDGDVFAAAVLRAAAMVSKEKELPHLQAVRVQGSSDGMLLSVTDRYRIGLEALPWTRMTDVDVLFPGRAAAAFAVISDGPVYLLDDGAQWAGLSDGTWTVITRRTPGEPLNLAGYLARQPAPEAALTVDAQTLAVLLGNADQVKPAKKGDTEFPFVDLLAVPGQPLQLRLERGVTGWTAELAGVTADQKLVAAFKPGLLAGMLARLDGPVVLGMIPGDGGRVTKPAKVTCGLLPGWTGMIAGVDPARAKP